MHTPDPKNQPSDDDHPSPDGDLPMPLRWTSYLVELVGGVALIGLMVLTVTDALMRSLANRPILGGGDLIQVFLVVVVACAVPLCVAAGRAIAIELFVNLLPPLGRGLLQRFTALISAGVLLYLSWRCYINAGEAAMFGETTMLLRIPFGPFYGVLAVSFLLSSVFFLRSAMRPGMRPGTHA